MAPTKTARHLLDEAIRATNVLVTYLAEHQMTSVVGSNDQHVIGEADWMLNSVRDGWNATEG